MSVELGLFDEVADALHGLVDPGFGRLCTQPRRWGVKVWFDAPECPRQHYEAQVLSAKHVDDAEVLALEIGFHAEHPKPADNAAVAAVLAGVEDRWRAELGDAAVLGPFLGRTTWRRLSETWADPDLSDPELCLEVADRLASYVAAVEPVLARR